ncbi:MAG: transporter substrate-binding domain-containing protein [Saprospiraceae bacterium]|nr:transporter substrate-binding domain-containing protein [Saprospiraceae bacterium]
MDRKNHDQSSSTSIKTFADGLWWAAVTMTTVGYGDKVPNSKAGKVMGIIWIFTSIILLSLFTANASAILNRSVEEIPIQTKEDLRGVTVGAVQKSSGEEYLLREHIEYERFENIDAALDALLNDKIDCVVSNVPVIQYLNKHDKRYFNQLAIASNWLLRNNMGIALSEESPLKEPIDNVLLQLISEKKWQQALYEYLGE